MVTVRLSEKRRARFRIGAGFTSKVNLVTDAWLIAAAVFAAHGIRRGLDPADIRALASITAALLSSWIVTAAALRHYATQAYARTVIDEVAMITTQVSAMATVIAFIELVGPRGTPMPPLGLTILLLWTPLLILRLAVFRPIAAQEEPVEEALIVGSGAMGRLTAQDIRFRGSRRLLGHLRFAEETDKDLEMLRRSYEADGERCAMLGRSFDLETVLRRVAVDEVYLAGSLRKDGDEIQAAIRVCEKFGVPFAMPACTFRLDRAQAAAAHAIADGYIHYETRRVSAAQQSLKRLFDIVASAAALWLLLPLFVVVATVIRLTSRGPVFFKQTRVGLHGRQFHMLKFRSMVANADSLKAFLKNANEQSGPVFKMKRDPRVTAIGRFIRKYSIDELPQLINVLRGDMSLVGPRPPVPDEVAQYEGWQRRRLSVRPGLTCIWQVSGRNQISFEQWMLMDMQYIDNWSLVRDFNLIFRTVPVVISGRGAS